MGQRGTTASMAKHRADLEVLLTAPELAERLRVAVGTVYNWAYRGQIPSQKVGTRLMFSPRTLRRWLRERERNDA